MVTRQELKTYLPVLISQLRDSWMLAGDGNGIHMEDWIAEGVMGYLDENELLAVPNE